MTNGWPQVTQRVNVGSRTCSKIGFNYTRQAVNAMAWNKGRDERIETQLCFRHFFKDLLPCPYNPVQLLLEQTWSPGRLSCWRVPKDANKNQAQDFLHPHSEPHSSQRERKRTQTLLVSSPAPRQNTFLKV